MTSELKTRMVFPQNLSHTVERSLTIQLFVFCKLPTVLLLGMRLSALHSFMFSQEEQHIKKIGAHRINHIEDIFMHDYNRVLGQLFRR